MKCGVGGEKTWRLQSQTAGSGTVASVSSRREIIQKSKNRLPIFSKSNSS